MRGRLERLIESPVPWLGGAFVCFLIATFYFGYVVGWVDGQTDLRVRQTCEETR